MCIIVGRKFVNRIKERKTAADKTRTRYIGHKLPNSDYVRTYGPIYFIFCLKGIGLAWAWST